MLKISRVLTPAEVSALCTLLLTSEVSISQLALGEELPPGTADQLGSAIKCLGTIHTMSLGPCHDFLCNQTPELFQALLAVASPALEQLSISHLYIENDWLIIACHSFSRFTALRSLTIAESIGCDIPLLVAFIGKLRALESLQISHVNIKDSNVGMLAEILGDNLPQLVELSICSGWLGSEAGRPIGSLVALGRLQKLDLKHNLIGDVGRFPRWWMRFSIIQNRTDANCSN